jgi:hypothetical protein
MLKDCANVSLDDDDEITNVKIAIVKALAVLCRMHRESQELMRNNGTIEILVDLLGDENEQLRKWACHALFVALLNNADNQTIVITIPSLVSKLNALKNEDWPVLWESNQALQIMKILGWHDVSNDV